MSEEKLIRKQVYLSYKGAVSKLIYVFLKIRTTILPLDVFDKEIPSKGVIIEVGSGHGVVSKYLALSSPFRRLYAYDPDRIRTEIAKNTSTGIDNLCFYSERFSRSPYENVSGVIIIGVLYLINDKSVSSLLSDLHTCLDNDGVLYISDILPGDRFDMIHFLHLLREHVFRMIGFTKGDGLYFRSLEDWKLILHESGFVLDRTVKAKVFLHRPYDFICKKVS